MLGPIDYIIQRLATKYTTTYNMKNIERKLIHLHLEGERESLL